MIEVEWRKAHARGWTGQGLELKLRKSHIHGTHMWTVVEKGGDKSGLRLFFSIKFTARTSLFILLGAGTSTVGRRRLAIDDEVKEAIHSWLRTKPRIFLSQGIYNIAVVLNVFRATDFLSSEPFCYLETPSPQNFSYILINPLKFTCINNQQLFILCS
jgi:hypothetical protein